MSYPAFLKGKLNPVTSCLKIQWLLTVVRRIPQCCKMNPNFFGRPGFDHWVGNIPWRRKWQPIPVFLPEESNGWRSLVGYSPRGHKELDTTEQLHFHFMFYLNLSVSSSWHIFFWSCQHAFFVRMTPPPFCRRFLRPWSAGGSDATFGWRRASLMAQTVKNLPEMQETRVQSLSQEYSLEKEIATHSPVFLPGEFHGQRSLVGYHPWGCKESDMTEWLTIWLKRWPWPWLGHPQN